jgi:hypothetical protein
MILVARAGLGIYCSEAETTLQQGIHAETLHRDFRAHALGFCCAPRYYCRYGHPVGPVAGSRCVAVRGAGKVTNRASVRHGGVFGQYSGRVHRRLRRFCLAFD